jgi:hypothetical protein
MDLERQVVDRDLGAEALGQVLDFDHGASESHPPGSRLSFGPDHATRR